MQLGKNSHSNEEINESNSRRNQHQYKETVHIYNIQMLIFHVKQRHKMRSCKIT